MQCLVTKLNVKINSTKLDSFLTPILEYDTETNLLKMYSANGASIYYTLDGSTPTIESILYTEPIEIHTSTLKIIVVKGMGVINVPILTVNYDVDESTMSVNCDYPMMMSTNNSSFSAIDNEYNIPITIGNMYTIKSNNEVSFISIKN